jgi:hypothetical protein
MEEDPFALLPAGRVRRRGAIDFGAAAVVKRVLPASRPKPGSMG